MLLSWSHGYDYHNAVKKDEPQDFPGGLTGWNVAATCSSSRRDTRSLERVPGVPREPVVCRSGGGSARVPLRHEDGRYLRPPTLRRLRHGV
ncbi:hypothetical protein HPB47_019803 [Ixodes persulcatus]|uniref:Uncharacterized protein n=1 Tax=Ixodes persulcatus TaxID=34615 RepID=A0AC60QH86_IXOPE|nr:hypothetical protein HPB47_019803 [Ixodes persulcatus]